MPVLGNEHVIQALKQSKQDKQRQEIARLSVEVERLTNANKALLFQLNKERKANEQLREHIKSFPIGGAK